MKNKELRILIRALAIGYGIVALIVLGMGMRLTFIGMATPRWLLVLQLILGPGGLIACAIVVACQELKKALDERVNLDANITYYDVFDPLD